MNSFELNKILGAILGTCLVVLAVHLGANAMFTVEKPAKPGYKIAVKGAGEQKVAVKKPETPLPVLLAQASAAKGKQIAQQCQACHTLGKGEANKIGPNLWNIVGSSRGEGRNGYKFSSAMKKKGGKWTFDELFKFIKDPRGYIPGTAMTFAGLASPEQRADVIVYLRTLSDHPLPVPKPAAEKEKAAAQPAAGVQKAPAASTQKAPAPEAQKTPAKKVAPKEASLTTLLAHASVAKGAQIAGICQACHNVKKGAGPKVGPDLWGVVGRPRASEKGFNYSAAMKKKGGQWTPEEIFKFIKDPRSDIPGTLMTFAGLPSPQQRADVIAYLNTLSDNPKPLPKPAGAGPAKEQPAAAPAKPSGAASDISGGSKPAESKPSPSTPSTPSTPAK